MPRRAESTPDPLASLRELPLTLTRVEAARQAGCSTRHLDRAIARGEILTLSHGRHRVVLRDSLHRWLAASLAVATDRAGEPPEEAA